MPKRCASEITRRKAVAAAGAALFLLLPGLLRPQESQVPSVQVAATTDRSGEALERVIALHLDHVSLAKALKVVALRAGVTIAYSAETIPVNRLISLTSDHILVRDALTFLLENTGMEAVVAAPGFVAIRPSHATPVGTGVAQGTVTLSGVIRDSATATGIARATVHIQGTALTAVSGGDGKYQIVGVPTGDFRVSVHRVGYVAKSAALTITDAQTVATLDFAINQLATKLDEVVTTALGAQRRYEVGNVIGTINVDSLAPTAPVASVTDVLSARIPGVIVEEDNGMVGSGETIRIRGQSSLLLQSDPIIIIDGVRQDNANYGIVPIAEPSPSRINDLDFSQIATIDILKGPAATTEYGTDAANGVIVITTKRGTSGSPLWHASASDADNIVPRDFPNIYNAYGHSTDGTHALVACHIVPSGGGVFQQYGGYDAIGMVTGTCVNDSISAFQPLNHAATSEFGSSPSQKYDLDVSGGSEAVRYYVAGGISNSVGGTHLPPVFRSEAYALGYTPSEVLTPNTLNQRSARVNSNIRLSPTAEGQITISYTSTSQTIPGDVEGALDYVGQFTGLFYANDSADQYGYGPYNNSLVGPLGNFGIPTTQSTNAFNGGLNLSWRPWNWLNGHGTLGVQHESQSAGNVSIPQAYDVPGNPYPCNDCGSGSDNDATSDIYTGDLRLAATLPLSRLFKSITSFGVQMVENHSAFLSASAYGLSLSNPTLNMANNASLNVGSNASGTLGGYLEEEIGYADRLFLTGALRIDAGSGFGHSYTVQPYEKASVSWLAVTDGPTTVRFRGALGGAGVQPPVGAALQEYYENTYTFLPNGTQTTGLALSLPGTPGLQPERSLEYEAGVDLGFWHSRVNVEFTDYNKTTQNTIYGLPTGWEFNNMTYYENLGEISNGGLELVLSATVVDTRTVNWNLTLNASTNHNKLTKLATGIQTSQYGFGAAAHERFAVGYPLYGYWGATDQYVDANHDGILEYNEVTFDTTAKYLGSSVPTEEMSLSTYFGLWRGTFTVGAMFDYRGGYKLYDGEAYWLSTDGDILFAQNRVGAPLWEQNQSFVTPCCFGTGDAASKFLDATEVRFRELSLTYNLPKSWAHSARLTTLGITLAIRNLALWTKFPGDPDASGVPRFAGVSQVANSSVVNNDYRADNGNVPLPQSWMVRLNVGF